MRKIVLALGVSAILVYAGNNEVTAVVGGVSPLSSNKYDDHITYGIRVGAGIKNAIIDQLEIGYDYSDNVKYTSIIYPPTKNKSSVHRFYFNAIKEFDISGAIKSAKPTKLYGLAGIGYQRFSKDVPTEKNGAFGQYGAGLKYYFTDNVALRGEVRHGIKFNSPHRSNLFYSLGITYAFGEKKQEVVVPPSLNDVTTPPVVKPVVKPVSINEAGVKGTVVKTISLSQKDFTFATNSAEIPANGESILQDIANDLKAEENLNIKVLIKGHTDSVGSDVFNVRLSEKRAKSVKDNLVKKGVSSNRITTRGYGEVEPIKSNDTKEGRAANRRVEIIFVQ